jgi:hypothetical protein
MKDAPRSDGKSFRDGALDHGGLGRRERMAEQDGDEDEAQEKAK